MLLLLPFQREMAEMTTEIEDVLGFTNQVDKQAAEDPKTPLPFQERPKKIGAMEPEDPFQIAIEVLRTRFFTETETGWCRREVGGKRKDNQVRVLPRKRCFEEGDNKQEPGSKRHKNLIKIIQKPTKNLQAVRLEKPKPLFNPYMGQQLNQSLVTQSKKWSLGCSETISRPPLKKLHLKKSTSGRWQWCN